VIGEGVKVVLRTEPSAGLSPAPLMFKTRTRDVEPTLRNKIIGWTTEVLQKQKE